MDIINKKMELAKDSKTRTKLVDENGDIILAMIDKHSDDIEFIKAVIKGLEELLEKCKESK